MKRLIPYYICFLLAAWWSVAASAQDKFRLQRFSVNDGISQGIVQDIVQDHNGYIWFSTWNGLNKYDGYTFRAFKSHPGEQAALSSNRIIELKETASGDIWCRTQERQAYLFDSQTETFIDVLKPYIKEKPSLHIDKMICLDNGVTWLLSAESNICFRVDENKLNTDEAVQVFDKNTPNWHAGRVWQIKTDADGDEWVLTDQGINLIGRKRMNSDFPFRHMTEKSNRIWLISADGQLARYTPEGIHFLEQASGVQQVHQMKAISDTLLTVGTNAGLWLVHIPEGRMEQVDVRSATQPSTDVLNVFKDSNRRLWMFTHSAGVVMYDMKSRECAHLQPPIHQVSLSNDHPFVYEDALGVIRVNPREGCLSYYDPQSNTLKPYVNPDGSVLKTAIRVFLVDRQKNVWYGAARNLYHITFYHDNVDYLPSLNRQEARCLFVDRGKNLWIGSKDERLRMYRDSDTDKAPLYLDTNGRLQTQPARFFANVYAMMQDSDNNLWIGTRGQGLILARPMPDGNYTLQRFHSDPADEYSISSNDIYALCQDRRGHIWIGAYQGGLNLLQTDGGHYRFIHGGNRLKNYPFPYIKSKVRSIAEAPDGTILAGASEGLLAFGSDFDRPENIKFRMHTAQYDYSDGMTCTEVMHVGVTHKGIYLATATGGFNKIRSANLLADTLRFRSLGVRDGLMSDLALSVLESEDDVWLVTENYLIRHNRRSNRLEQYGSNFFHDEIYFSEAAPVRLPDGRLLFATVGHGVISLSPHRLQERSYTPPLVFTGLRVRGHTKNYPLDNVDSIVLQPDERFVTFQFAALDYTNTSGIQYAYRLRGLDKDWNYCGTLRSANYNNLPPGEYVFELRSTNSDGRWVDNERTLHIRVQPSFWGSPAGIALAIILFLTAFAVAAVIVLTHYKLKQRVALEQKLAEVKTSFFTNIVHEMRTPFTLIVSPLEEALAQPDLSPRVRQNLEIMQANTRRSIRLINQILDFQKLTAGKMRLSVRRVELRSFFEQLLHSFAGLAESENTRLSLQMETPTLTIWADTDKLETIFFNLLSNAFKYSPRGRQITVNIGESEGKAVISVTDQGYGIPEERQTRLFDRFESFVQRHTPRVPGTGIGLSLIKQLVELHHGTIGVSSVVGSGSTFTVELPEGKSHFPPDTEFIVEDDEELPATPVAGTERDAEGDERPLILIVEDNAGLRSFLESAFAASYRVATATNGEEGFLQAVSRNPDLVVSDLRMPVVDGVAMIKMMRATAATSHIPVVLLTGESTTEGEIEGLRLGIEDYIAKPFSSKVLLARVDNILTRRAVLRRLYQEQIIKPEPDAQPASGATPEQSALPPAEQAFVDKLTADINEHLGSPDLGVESLSRRMGMSRSVLTKKTKSLIGLAPGELIRDLRLRRAAALLEEGGRTISEIAFLTGFYDSHYFSNCFKQIYGVSPTDYRKSNRSG